MEWKAAAICHTPLIQMEGEGWHPEEGCKVLFYLSVICFLEPKGDSGKKYFVSKDSILKGEQTPLHGHRRAQRELFHKARTKRWFLMRKGIRWDGNASQRKRLRKRAITHVGAETHMPLPSRIHAFSPKALGEELRGAGSGRQSGSRQEKDEPRQTAQTACSVRLCRS